MRFSASLHCIGVLQLMAEQRIINSLNFLLPRDDTMTKPTLHWDEDALARLQKAPFFVRRMARNKVEKAAIAQGQTRITLALFEAIKQQEMGR